MRRRPTINFEVNHDRWLVSYADFVTLLFAFFVVLYSISQVNEGKYRVLSNTLIQAFDITQSAIKPIQVGSPTLASSPNAVETYMDGDGRKSASAASDGAKDNRNVADLDELSDAFADQFSDLLDDDLLKISGNELWLELELSSNILFSSGNSEPSLQARVIFEEMAGMLSKFENPVQVEGFTDNIPINNNRFKSNWELSSSRSASVVELLANNGVDPYRLSAVGYGEFRPKADNATEGGRSLNRRVVLMISREAAERPKIQGEQEVEDLVGGNATQVPDNILNDAAVIDDTVTPAESERPIITPIQLDNGGLLFTNDPDLPRPNN